MRKAYFFYFDGQPCRRGDTIATCRLGQCKVNRISVSEHIVYVTNIRTKEKFEMCEIGISESDLIDRMVKTH
jgi:hypothetical protein